MNNAKTGKGKRKMWIVLVIVGVIAVGLLGGFLADGPGRREIAELSFAEGNFDNLRDGTYVGEFKGSKSHMRDAKVEVTVSGGEVSGIRILKGAVDKDGKPVKLSGGHTIEDLFDRVVKSQSLQVDTISGATLTSKSHLKALENALRQAR